LRSIFPSNFCGGGGICAPAMVVVALGEPGVPVICWADAGRLVTAIISISAEMDGATLMTQLLNEIVFPRIALYSSSRWDALMWLKTAPSHVLEI
jgi:hypothetical protein